MVVRAIAAWGVEGPVCRRGGWWEVEMGCKRRVGARGVIFAGGAREGVAVLAADDEAVTGPDG